MPKKKWSELNPATRRFLVVGGAVEGLLKIAALTDLLRRPSSEIRGSKPRWAAAIVFVNSLGVVPIAYFVRGRTQ